MADPFTPEQTEALTQILGTTVNNMITARIGTLQQKLEKSLTDSLGTSFAKTLDDKLKDFKPADPPDPEGGKGGKGGKGNDRTEDIRFASLNKEVERLTREGVEAKKRGDAERAKNRASTLRSATYKALAENGIDGEFYKDGAFARLSVGSNVRFRDEDSDDIIFVDASGVETDLGVGLKDWASKSPEAKIYMPPSGAKGSGGRPAPRTPIDPKAPKKVTFEDVGQYVLGQISQTPSE